MRSASPAASGRAGERCSSGRGMTLHANTCTYVRMNLSEADEQVAVVVDRTTPEDGGVQLLDGRFPAVPKHETPAVRCRDARAGVPASLHEHEPSAGPQQRDPVLERALGLR